MWLKLTGIIFILISGSGTGWAIAHRYIYRVNYLQELYMAVNLINTEIVYNQTVLSEALKKTSGQVEKPVSDLFETASKHLNDEKDILFASLWSDILKESTLCSNDRKIMLEWGKKLGKSQINEQEKNNKLTMEKLANAKKRAERTADKKVKLARYSGVLISFMIIILCC